MRVLLVRHGQAVDPYGAPSDDSRWLTPEGRAAFHRVAEALREAGVALDRIWCSPLVRAVQTAQILAGPDHGGPLEVWPALAPEYGTTAQALAPLDGVGPDETVAFVGHEPKIRILAGHLAGERQMPGFYPGAACLVEVGAAGGAFLWMMDPKTLARVETLGEVRR